MGEAKRRREQTEHDRAMDELSKALADRGCAIEAGWVALRKVWLDPASPPGQVRDLRWAFMAGAQHTFSTIMGMLDPGDDATDADLSRLDKMNAELARFVEEMNAAMPTKGGT